MSIDIEAIKAKLAGLTAPKPNKANRIPYLKLGVGEHKIRVIAWPGRPSDDPFPSLKFSFIVNPKLVIPEGADPISELAASIRHDKSIPDGWKVARELEHATYWYAAVLDRANEAVGLQLMTLKQPEYVRLMEFFVTDGIGDFQDPVEGFDVDVKIIETSKMWGSPPKPVLETKMDAARRPSPLHKDSAKAKEILDSLPTFVKKFHEQFKPATTKEMEVALKKWSQLKEGPQADTETRGPKISAPATATNVAEVKSAATTRAADDLDSAMDDLLS